MAITRQKMKKIEKEVNAIKEEERKPSMRDLHSDDPVIAAKADGLLCKILEEHRQNNKLWALQRKE